MKNTRIIIISLLAIVVLAIATWYAVTLNINEERSQNEIVLSVKPSSIVREIPEVKEWMALFTQDGQSPNTGGVPILEEVEFKDGIYTIHLYERMDDRIVTFGWFYLDPVKKEIVDSNGRYYESDSWFGI